jgi:hypothetical protein
VALDDSAGPPSGKCRYLLHVLVALYNGWRLRDG